MPNIHHELLIGAPAETVYGAITTQEGLSGWWTPGAKATPELNSIARFPFGPDYFKEMKIMELEPPNWVKWLCIKGAEEWVGTTLSFKIEHGDKGALLSFHPELGDQRAPATTCWPTTRRQSPILSNSMPRSKAGAPAPCAGNQMKNLNTKA